MGKPTLASIVGTTHAGVPASGGLPSLSSVLGGAASLPSLKDALSTRTVKAKPAHHGGGGLLGLLGRTGSDLESAAVNAPAGLYKIAKDLAGPTPKGEKSVTQQWIDLLHGHLDTKNDPAMGDVRAIATSTKDSLVHPLRHPGYTLLNVLPLASGASRLGIAASEASRGAEAGSLTSRALSSGDLTVHPETPKSGLGQIVAKGTDTLLQRAADKNPGGVGASLLNRRIGKTLTADASQAARNAKGPALALAKLGARLTGAQQKALQIVAEQAPLDERITAASARVVGARSPLAREGHKTELDLLHQAKPLLTVRDGKPVFADGQAGLEHVYGAMVKVAKGRENLLKELDLLSSESTASRVTEAGRVSLGAKYEQPTPGKLGVPSQALLRARSDVDRLQALHDRALTKTQSDAASRAGERDAVIGTKIVGPGAERASVTATAVGQSAVRLHELEQQHNAALDKIANAEFGPIEQKVVNDRTRDNLRAARQEAGVTRSGRKSGASTAKSIAKVSVKEERRRHAEQFVEERIAGNPEHPVSKAWRARTDEIDKLRALVNPELGETPKGIVTSPGRVVAAPGGARAERIGAALSMAKDKLERLEGGAVSRVVPTGVLGAEHFAADEDAVRIPDVATRKGAKALSKQATIGGQGTIGHQRAPGSVTHSYTGVLREHGLRRQDTTALVAESALEASKYAGLKHIHELVRKAARSTPSRPDDIAVRLDEMKPSEKMPLTVRKFLGDPEEYLKHATPAEASSALDRVRQQMFIQPAHLDATAKAEFERLNAAGKIGWVPKRMLGDLANPAAPLRAVAPGKTVGTVDAINNASRFAILYLKPAYALPNILGNTALALVQQGWAAPRNLAQAARLVQKLHQDDYAKIDAAMGEGVAKAISAHGQGKLSRATDLAAGKWSAVVDTPFRRASFLHEARQAGFKTPEQIHGLLGRDASDAVLVKIGVRANRDAIDYENLTPTEREIVRRVVFFYPWVKGSTVYAGRFLRDHPVQAAGVGQTGQIGKKYSDQSFGALPSYLEGLIPVGGNRAINPSSAAVFETPAQLAMAVQGLVSGNIPEVASAANYYTPAVSLALALAGRQDPGTGIPYAPGQRDAAHIAYDQLFSSLPQVSLINALRGKSRSKIYPSTPSNAIGQFLLGGTYPRTINRSALSDAAYAEQERLRTGR